MFIARLELVSAVLASSVPTKILFYNSSSGFNDLRETPNLNKTAVKYVEKFQVRHMASNLTVVKIKYISL